MFSHDADLALIRRCAKGDETALRGLVTKYQTLSFGIARRYLGNVEDAEDIAVRAFLKVWKSASSFRGECSVRAYICQITMNLCRDHRRDRPLPEGCVPCAVNDSSELGDRVMAGLEMLPTDERELLILYYLDSMDYEEICSVLDIGYDVLKTRLVRARKRLRTILDVSDER